MNLNTKLTGNDIKLTDLLDSSMLEQLTAWLFNANGVPKEALVGSTIIITEGVGTVSQPTPLESKEAASLSLSGLKQMDHVLAVLESLVPPKPNARHAFIRTNGSLSIQLNTTAGSQVLVFEANDYELPIAKLVSNIVSFHYRSIWVVYVDRMIHGETATIFLGSVIADTQEGAFKEAHRRFLVSHLSDGSNGFVRGESIIVVSCDHS